MRAVVLGGTIHLTSDAEVHEFSLPVIAHSLCPPDTMYFMPSGAHSWNTRTGEEIELLPGCYVNPKRLGVITSVK